MVQGISVQNASQSRYLCTNNGKKHCIFAFGQAPTLMAFQHCINLSRQATLLLIYEAAVRIATQSLYSKSGYTSRDREPPAFLYVYMPWKKADW
jgi:hypothetical protein